MANLLRTAKSGADWTQTDLAAYNIECHRQDPPTYFGFQILVDPELLETVRAANEANGRTAPGPSIHLTDNTRRDADPTRFLKHVAEFLDEIGFLADDRAVRARQDLGLVVCGERRRATPDVCLIGGEQDQDVVLLVVQEGRRGRRGDVDRGAEVAQVIVQAIAAFSANNEQRVKAGKGPIDTQVMNGMTVSGRFCTWYKIPVTQDLVQHIARGTYPPNPTRVTSCNFP